MQDSELTTWISEASHELAEIAAIVGARTPVLRTTDIQLRDAQEVLGSQCLARRSGGPSAGPVLRSW